MDNIYDNENFFKSYSEMSRSEKGLDGAGEWHQLKALFPVVKGKKVLDLGCGYGWHCRYAAEQGAEYVLGIDSGKKMIAEAANRNPHAAIEYKVCGLDEYSYPENEFDLVISNLVLHYIENLDEVYANVYRTLKSGGVFLFNIEHPIFTSGINEDWLKDADGKILCWPIDGYFYTGERVTDFIGHKVAKQHHTLTQILGGLLNAGFLIKTVEEAVPPQNMMDMEGMEDELRRPMMLLVKTIK